MTARALTTFTGSGGGSLDLSASATFTVSGTTLTVVLTNTSSTVSTLEAQVLTAVFFSAPTATTRTSALLAPGSNVVGSLSNPPGGNVGPEWAYNSGISFAPGGANSGISSAAFPPSGWFPNSTKFGAPLSDLSGGASIDGMQYGIVSPSTTTLTGELGMIPGMINHSVVFVLDGFTGSEADISNVSFQYGSNLGFPNLVGTAPIPEPSSALLFGVGTLVAGAAIRRRPA